MTTGQPLTWLKQKADEEGISMSELGRRGGLKAASNRRKRQNKIRHSDEYVSSMWWNND